MNKVVITHQGLTLEDVINVAIPFLERQGELYC